jgi:Holliday junction resolvase RusA-like endonuclease
MKLTILGEPIAKGRPRLTTFGGHARAYTPKATRDAETNIRAQIVNQLPKDYIPAAGAIFVNILIHRRKPTSTPKKVRHAIKKPDLDNYLKTVLDAMNTIVFKDDSQIITIHASKVFGDKPRIEIDIGEVV